MMRLRWCGPCEDRPIVSVSGAVAGGLEVFRIVALLVGEEVVKTSGGEALTGTSVSEETDGGGMLPIGVVSED
jgi:hypothetical protein